MKNLKFLMIVSLLLTLTSESQSQTLRIKAGPSFTNISYTYWAEMSQGYGYLDGTAQYDTKAIMGYLIGASLEFPFTTMFSFEPALMLTTHGAKTEKLYEFDEVPFDNLKITYIEIPLTVKMKFGKKLIKPYALLGPYIGIGVNGQISMDEEITDIQWGSDSEMDDLKRFDLGLTGGAGVEIKSIQIGINYSLGLANISSYTDEETKICNRVLALSIGYMFGKK